MNLPEYIALLKDEIEYREKVIAAIDNYLLEQGYRDCLVKVLKDLQEISGIITDSDFYPDKAGFIGGKQ